MFFGSSITSIIATLLAVLLAITFHETAHGFAAYKLGDPTAKNQGRGCVNDVYCRLRLGKTGTGKSVLF